MAQATHGQMQGGLLQGVSVQTPLGGDAFAVSRFEYVEELGEPFQITLELESGKKLDDPAGQLVGKTFSVTLTLTGGGTRHFHAFMESFDRLSHDGQLGRYRAVGIPWFSLLKHAHNSQIFLNKNVRDIMQEVFGSFDFAAYDVKGFYPKSQWESRTQYRESYFNFIQRSLQQEGIYYFWTHEQSKHTMGTCDNFSNHAPFPGYEKIPYRTAERGQESQEHIYEWNSGAMLQPSAVVLKDYNYNDPGMSLVQTRTAQEALGPSSLVSFDHPGMFQTTAEGDRYAQIRMEERECRQRVFRGRAQCLGLAAGCTFSLKEFPVQAENASYLTTTMKLTVGVVDEPAGGTKAAESGYWYDCEFTAIPASVQYRSRFSATVPQVLGLQSAFVYAPDGQDPQTPYTDSLGRIQLLFPWSRNSVQTAWVRKSQVMAGNGWGHMHCPRPGDEVLVAFEHGIVDRPVIVGCLYNGNTQPPLPLPEAAHIHVFKDQGGNILSINPQSDGQTILVYSPVDNSWIVVGAGTPNPS